MESPNQTQHPMKKIINTLEEAVITDLECLYCVEFRLKEKLEIVVKVINTEKLRDLLETYLESSNSKRLKIDRVFSYLNHDPKSCTTSVIDEMIEDIFRHISFAGEPTVQDLLITNCLQRISNYKLSLYQSSLRYAEELELDTASELLSTIIDWEQETKRDLAEFSASQVRKCSLRVVS